MKTVLEFAVWTLGLSIAIPVYLEQTYLPRSVDLVYVLVLLGMVLSVLSLIFGVVFRSAASKDLAGDPNIVLGKDAETRFPYLWKGAAHSWLLAGALCVVAVIVILDKVVPPTAKAFCNLPIFVGDQQMSLTYDCGSSPKEIFDSGKLEIVSKGGA